MKVEEVEEEEEGWRMEQEKHDQTRSGKGQLLPETEPLPSVVLRRRNCTG